MSNDIEITFVGLRKLEYLNARKVMHSDIPYQVLTDKLNEVIQQVNILIDLKNGEVNR